MEEINKNSDSEMGEDNSEPHSVNKIILNRTAFVNIKDLFSKCFF